MTEQEQGRDIPVYQWRCAPAFLRTRRQLAAQGQRPNGQDIKGRIPFRRHGREQVAYLYDVREAAPKRPATPAQLAALEKATRERQLRAAERRGIDRAELTTEFDPGPAWTTPTTNAFAGLSTNAFAAGREQKGLSR